MGLTNPNGLMVTIEPDGIVSAVIERNNGTIREFSLRYGGKLL
jgi:hypothetical protein